MGFLLEITLQIEFQQDGAVVGAVDVAEDTGVLEVREEAVADQVVVDAPSGIVLAGVETVGPPRVGSSEVGVEMAEGVGETAIEQECELVALLLGETGVAEVGLGVLDVYLMVGDVHIAADDDGFLLVEPADKLTEGIVPLHAVGQAAQAILGVGGIDGDIVEVEVLQGDDVPLVVMLVNAHAEGDTEGGETGVGGSAAVAFLLSIVPVALVAEEIEVELTGLHLGLLQGEDVGIQTLEDVSEAFAGTGSQSVEIP